MHKKYGEISTRWEISGVNLDMAAHNLNLVQHKTNELFKLLACKATRKEIAQKLKDLNYCQSTALERLTNNLIPLLTPVNLEN